MESYSDFIFGPAAATDIVSSYRHSVGFYSTTLSYIRLDPHQANLSQFIANLSQFIA